MPADVQKHIDAVLAQGFSVAQLHAALSARLAKPCSQPTIPPPPAGTAAARGGPPEDAPQHAGTRPPHPAVPPDAPRIEGLSRYDDLGPIGMGGMGEVRRVRDRRLGRVLALKTLHAPALSRPSLVARFLEEAQATAQLQHPGIVPIHDLGTLPDGRLWFTMKEVTGQTFGAVISEVHARSRTRWQPAASGWTLRRLVDALHQVCEAVGYAHSRGVVHRDLKPDNIMVGSHGEVLVLDWGLAKVLGRPDLAAEDGELDPVQTDRSRASAHQTQVGQVAGTPAYMPPEQALGKVDQIDARSDVYALGALLYEVLSGHCPYPGHSAVAVLEQVRRGPPAALVGGRSPAYTLDFGFDLRPVADIPQGPPLPLRWWRPASGPWRATRQTGSTARVLWPPSCRPGSRVRSDRKRRGQWWRARRAKHPRRRRYGHKQPPCAPRQHRC